MRKAVPPTPAHVAQRATNDEIKEHKRKPQITRIEEVLDDPLSMPPPYWRSSRAIFHVLSAMQSMVKKLSRLAAVIAKTSRELDQHYEQFGEDHETDEALKAFSTICESLWELEHLIKLDSERAILMSAITAEDEINAFCVFNLHRDFAESIEKLSVPEKLLVASAAVGKPGIKGEAVYEKAVKLNSWRNAFAHGHCVDRPVKSLRHNHLVHPDEYPGVPNAVASVIEFVGGFLSLSRYLRSMSKNEYTSGDSHENCELDKSISALKEYSFWGTEDIYSVNREPKAENRSPRNV